MAYLINRVAPARFQCLQVLCRMINQRFGMANSFQMNDVKYNPPSSDIKEHCYLLITNPDLSINYCPYKRNPLDKSGCFITNGLYVDTTKSKEISNTINALDALGFVQRRSDNSITLTKEGKQFAETDYYSNTMLDIIQSASLRYGVVVGFLGRILAKGMTSFKSTDFTVGYPDPEEFITVRNEQIGISSGSQADSNTRTKSCLLAWATASGLIWPTRLLKKYDATNPHVQCLEYINKSIRSLKDYNVMIDLKSILSPKFVTEKPLDYNNLIKHVGALREHNQQAIREATMHFEPIIKNRRLAVILALQRAFEKNKPLYPALLIEHLSKYPNLFVVNESSFYTTMMQELEIAFSVGIPYLVASNRVMPLVGINIKEVTKNAPKTVVDILLTISDIT